MKFKLDENLPQSSVYLLQQHGHDVATVVSQNVSGISDNELLSLVQDEKRVLVTLDLDFSDIRTYPPEDYCGIVIIRFFRQDIDSLLKMVNRLSDYIQDEEINGKLWIIDENKLRIRGKN